MHLSSWRKASNANYGLHSIEWHFWEQMPFAHLALHQLLNDIVQFLSHFGQNDSGRRYMWSKWFFFNENTAEHFWWFANFVVLVCIRLKMDSARSDHCSTWALQEADWRPMSATFTGRQTPSRCASRESGCLADLQIASIGCLVQIVLYDSYIQNLDWKFGIPNTAHNLQTSHEASQPPIGRSGANHTLSIIDACILADKLLAR